MICTVIFVFISFNQTYGGHLNVIVKGMLFICSPYGTFAFLMSDLTSSQDILAVLSLATAMMDVPIGNLVIRLGAVSQCSEIVQCCLSSVGELNGAMMLIPTEFWWTVIVSVWSEIAAARYVDLSLSYLMIARSLPEGREGIFSSFNF